MNDKPLKKRRSVLKKFSGYVKDCSRCLTDFKRIEVFGNKKIFIENTSKILKYDSESIVIQCGNLIIEITGKNLRFLSLCETNLQICGEILNIALSEK